MSAIDELEEALWYGCVRQVLAADEAVAQIWDADPFQYYSEGFEISPISHEDKDLIEPALEEWAETEAKVLQVMQMSRADFVNLFRQVRQQYIDGNDDWKKDIEKYGIIAAAVVKNISWVALFAWTLPAAYPVIAPRVKPVGQVVTALFYLELLYRGAPGRDDSVMKKTDAFWRMADKQQP